MPSAVSFLFSSSYGFLCSSFFLITFIFQDKPKPISIYHPTAEELFASTGTPMEGFFEGADVMFRTIASAAPAASQGVSAEAPIPSTKPVPIEGIHTEGVSEATPNFAETPTPQEGAIPSAAQTEVASPTTPLVISISGPFATLSQDVKDGSSLVVTPSSIPSSANHGLDADLFFEGSEDVLEDLDDEPIIKKRISESDEEESANSETEFIGMCLFLPFSAKFPPLVFIVISSSYIYLCHPLAAVFPLLSIFILLIAETFKEPEVATDIGVPMATTPATSMAPVSTIPTVLASAIPVSATFTTPILTSPGKFSHFLPHFFLMSSLLLDHGFSY